VAPVVAPPAPAPAAAAPAGAPEPSIPAPPAQGTLEQFSPIALYGRIAAGGLTGLLTLTLSDRSIQLHFRKGSPEFVDSSHPEDSLGTLLLQAKLLTAEQLQQAEGGRARFGGDLLAALFGMGLLQPASTFNHLSQRALSILHKGLRAESGTFTYEPKELPAAKAMPMGNRWAVLSDQIRRLPSPDLKRRLQPVLNLPIMKSGGLVATSDLRLTPHEVRVLTAIDGVRSIAQLLADFPQDQEHILRLSLLLKELEAVSFSAAPQRAPEPKAAAPKPAAPNPPPAAAPKPAAPNPPPAAAPKPAAPNPPPAAAAAPGAPVLKPSTPAAAAAPGAPVPKPSAPAAAAAPGAPVLKPSAPAAAAAPTAAAGPATAPGADEIPTLRQTAAAMKGQNLFQRLGLTEQADAGAAKIAYFKLARLYHPDTLPPGAPPELEKLKAEIFGYIGDAYRTLTDEKSRKDYLEQLKAGDEGKEEVDVVAILQAEERFKRGTVFMKARKYAEAVKIFEEAIQLNADESEFHAWRAYARFCAAPDKKAAQPEAFRDIQAVIKKNDRCVPAHYFLGVIAKTLGDTAGALKHFRKTVELQPDHIDAQREIRMATQKK
jgi:tetratricopeptide (TPR) repeat protein